MKVTIVLALLFSIVVYAQDSAPPVDPTPTQNEMPGSRPKYDIELNKESSSYVTDPDSLDPLPLKKESIKEDDEPALDDIKSILKAKKKVEPKTPEAGTKTTSIKKKKAKRKKKADATANLNPDDPDLALEKKFNDIYNKYNINPTPDDVWGAASSKAANVYVVQKGDTLFSISKTLFGDSQFWPKIWALNKSGITNPHNIAPGTKVLFFPGDGSQAPSLSVGDALPMTATESPTDTGPKLEDYDKQNTEFNQLAKEGTEPQGFRNIPPSLPVYNGNLFYKPNTSTQVILTSRPETQDREPVNPFLLTSSQIKTRYKVPESDVGSLVCKDNQYVPAVTKVGKDTQPGRYNMLIPESFFFGRLKKTYIYRVVGEADVGVDESLRISQCINPVNSDLLLVNSEDMEAVKPPNELLPNTRSQIIEGVQVFSQQFFYSNQYVILNMSQLPALEGADLKVYSAQAGGVVGEIRILKRTGTMAVGYVLNSNELIQVGDRVIIPE
jgi:LysM repeat protein